MGSRGAIPIPILKRHELTVEGDTGHGPCHPPYIASNENNKAAGKYNTNTMLCF